LRKQADRPKAVRGFAFVLALGIDGKNNGKIKSKSPLTSRYQESHGKGGSRADGHAGSPRRLASVDALRGLAVAAMLLVNNPR
jgi:hypothetical protein